ncbi:MAG TPA: hypothetical protein VJ972_01385, partial [Anaerolineales bacterium]|nr:hypothetical protein [Anaerolineales bacterium]
LGVHDIGAIGYFTQNPIIDLAGLITPDVVPFIRDETRLSEYLDGQDAQYLVTFPSWYPQLTAGNSQIFDAHDNNFPNANVMTIYRWGE